MSNQPNTHILVNFLVTIVVPMGIVAIVLWPIINWWFGGAR